MLITATGPAGRRGWPQVPADPRRTQVCIPAAHTVGWGGGAGQRTGFREPAWQSPAPTHPCGETWGKRPARPVPQFPHHSSVDTDSVSFRGFQRGPREFMHREPLMQLLGRGGCSRYIPGHSSSLFSTRRTVGYLVFASYSSCPPTLFSPAPRAWLGPGL